MVRWCRIGPRRPDPAHSGHVRGERGHTYALDFTGPNVQCVGVTLSPSVGQEAPVPVQVRLLRALGIVAQTNDLAQSCEDRRLIVQTGSRAAAFAIVLRAAILVAVDADGVRRLLELPRLRAYPTADLGQVWWTPNFGPSAKVEQRPVLAARKGVCR